MKSLNFNKPFAIIKRKQDLNVLIFQGEIKKMEKLSEILIKLDKNAENAKKVKREIFESVITIPFSQIKERKFVVNDGGAKILCMGIKKEMKMPIEELLKSLPFEKIELEKEIHYNYSEKEYEEIIKSIIEKEIWNGEGANFVISRKASCKIKDMSVNKALSIYKNLLQKEIGSHWTFIFYTGENFLIGASPETYIAVSNGGVKMHPISGTFRKSVDKEINLDEFKREFINFLYNKKEINELFMVVDEELKMMAKICDKGGMIIGPLLKEMSNLIHTEYLLSGKSKKDIVEIIRKSMYVATVTGSPIENACRIISKYEKEDRRYYSGAIMLIKKDENNKVILDSSILIRTMEIDKDGVMETRAGPTIVCNSIPMEEVKETNSKLSRIIKCLAESDEGSETNASKIYPQKILPYFEEDPDVLEALQKRNQKLSKFWFFSQDDEDNKVKEIINKQITIINNEDDFCYMLRHMLCCMGAKVGIVRYHDYKFDDDDADVTIIGPGPGNPNELKNEKMKAIDEITKDLLNSNRKFLAICLGHQFLCKNLGLEVVRKKYPFQGTQEVIDLFGKRERVGFYNTFAGRYDKKAKDELENKFDIEISFDKNTKEIHAIRGKNFAGFQFHPESILTQNGMFLLKDALLHILTN